MRSLNSCMGLYDICFMDHLGRRIRGEHSFVDVTRGKVKVKSNYVKVLKSKLSKRTLIVQFCFRIKNVIEIDARQ